MNENGMDNNEYFANEQIRRDNLNGDIERRNQVDNSSVGDVSLRIGSGEGGDLWYSDAYQSKLEGEVNAVTHILNEIAGPDVFKSIEAKVDSGTTRSEAVLECAKDYLAGLESADIDLTVAADAVVDSLRENGIDIEDAIAGGKEGFKELISTLTEQPTADNGTDKFISDKLEELETALDKLEDRIEEVHAEADVMNDKRDNLAKYDDLSPRNTFRQWAVLAVKLQAHADGIEINGSVPRASDILVDISNQFRSNLFESVIELAFAKIEDAIEKRYDDTAVTDTDAGDTKGEGSSEAETEIPKPEDVDLPEPAEPETIDDTSGDTEKAPEGTDKVDAPTESIKEGLERINDTTTYSFSDFVNDHTDELSEDDGDARLISAYCDLVEEKGVENISADLTYSIAFYDKDGFCKGLDNIEAALGERGISGSKSNILIDNAVESYCSDPIVTFRQGTESIEFDIPVSRETKFDIDGETYTIGKDETVHYDIYMSEGTVISNMVSVENGDFYVPVDSKPGDVIPFVCDVLSDIYGKDMGTMVKDVAVMLEKKYPTDKSFILDKICDHIGDFIEARNSKEWEIYDVENNIVDAISAEHDYYDDIAKKEDNTDSGEDTDSFADDDSPIDFTDLDEED